MNWNEKQLAYIEWSALDPSERKFSNQKELAEYLDVSEDSLTNWKKLDGFSEAIVQMGWLLMEQATPQLLAVRRLHMMQEESWQAREWYFRFGYKQVQEARKQGYFNGLEYGGSSASGSQAISTAEAMRLLEALPTDQQEVFLQIYKKMGAVRDERKQGDQEVVQRAGAKYDVKKSPEDIAKTLTEQLAYPREKRQPGFARALPLILPKPHKRKTKNRNAARRQQLEEREQGSQPEGEGE